MSPQREREADRAIRKNTGARAGENRRRQNFTRDWQVRSVGIITPCWKCGAADARDRAHQQGCPELPPVGKPRLAQLARACEEGWGA